MIPIANSQYGVKRVSALQRMRAMRYKSAPLRMVLDMHSLRCLIVLNQQLPVTNALLCILCVNVCISMDGMCCMYMLCCRYICYNMVENDYHVLWSHKGTFDIPSWYSKHMNESIRKNGDCLGEIPYIHRTWTCNNKSSLFASKFFATQNKCLKWNSIGMSCVPLIFSTPTH